MEFINYCNLHRILLLVLPPHSTHTVQPLDVVIFKPLSTAYTNALVDHLHRTQGMVTIKKGEFLPLFWKAWISTFTPELVLKAFEATGISPLNANIILKKFTKRGDGDGGESSNLPQQPERPFIYAKRLLRSSVKDPAQPEARELLRFIQGLIAKEDLTAHQLATLEASIHYRKKFKRNNKVLDLQQREEFHSRAVFWSPSKVREARAREKVRVEEERQHQLKKAEMKDLREANKLYKSKVAEEKRLARERAKVVREKEKAEKLLERQRQKEKRDAEKAIKLSQSGKRKASAPIKPSNKRQKRSGVDAGGGVAPKRSPAPLTKTTSRGRNVHLPSKYR
jgi:hypothetical protein